MDDRDIHGGDEFVEAIINGINDSSEVFVLMTPESVDRPWVQREIGMALGSRKRLVVIHQHISPKKLGASVEFLQYADVNEVPKLVELAKHPAARSRKS